MTTTTRSFTERHQRHLEESRRSGKSGPRPGETAADWMVWRFTEIMRDHRDERIRERELVR